MAPVQIVKVEHLLKSYDKTVAVDDVSFQIHGGGNRYFSKRF